MASAMDLATTIKVVLNSTATKESSLMTGQGPLNKSWSLSMADGDSAGQADLLYEVSGTLSSGNNTTIDLLGSLSTIFGDTLNFAKIKALFIRNNSDRDSGAVLVQQ